MHELHSFFFESYGLGVKDFENNEAVIVTRIVTSWRDTVTS